MANNKLHFVEEKLQNLKSLKDAYNLSAMAKIWKQKANMKEVSPEEDENDFRTQVSGTVKRQKDAELSANMPEYSFIPLSDEGEKNRKIVRESWKYHWLTSNTDKQIGKVIKSATTYGTGIMYDGIKHTFREINEPYVVTKEDETKELKFRKKKIQKSEIFCEKIPFANFFINGTDIDNATEVVVLRYINKDEYVNDKSLNPMYKNISKVKKTSKSHPVGETDGRDISSGASDENIVTELSYYNVATDEYVVTANGIEVLNSHIPYMHKKLPFIPYYDNEAEDRFWWIGEFELLHDDELAKNEYRSLTIKGVKASIGFILKEKHADVDTADLKFGIQEVIETDDMASFEHFSPNVPVQAIGELERKVDDDIIAKSGVDFRSQHLTPWESATKTDNKAATTRKRINQNIRDNGNTFFRRLGEIRLKNIQQLHMMQPRRIPIEGGSIDSDGNFVADEAGAFGSAIIGSNFIEGDYQVVPIIETMLGNSKQRRKDNLNRFVQFTGNIRDDSGKPVIKWRQLVKKACEEYGYDFEKMTEEAQEAQSAEEVINNVFNEGTRPEEDPSNPNFVPPAQRSQRDQVNGISGLSELTTDEDE